MKSSNASRSTAVVVAMVRANFGSFLGVAVSAHRSSPITALCGVW
jgi:hypothetical protein